MKKLDKILLSVIVVLAVALIVMTIAFFKMKKTSEDNLQHFLDSEKQIVELKEKMDSYGISID